jgi:hypothetical protein
VLDLASGALAVTMFGRAPGEHEHVLEQQAKSFLGPVGFLDGGDLGLECRHVAFLHRLPLFEMLAHEGLAFGGSRKPEAKEDTGNNDPWMLSHRIRDAVELHLRSPERPWCSGVQLASELREARRSRPFKLH